MGRVFVEFDFRALGERRRDEEARHLAGFALPGVPLGLAFPALLIRLLGHGRSRFA